MKNLNTFEKGLVVGLIIGIGVTLLLLSLMSQHGPFGKHGPFSSRAGVEVRKFEEMHGKHKDDEEEGDDENDEDEEGEGLEEVDFDVRDLVPLGGIIVSLGVLAFGTGFLINALRKRNMEEISREREKDRLLRRLELIEEALLEGRIGEETYRELKAKYEGALDKHKQ